MAHIALTAYELENGGISRVALYLANGFAGHGHKVTLLLCTSAGERDADFRAQLSGDVDYVALSDKAYASRGWGQIARNFAYRKWLRENQPDIVLGSANNIAWFSGLGLLANRGARSKLYIKTTNPIIRERDGPLMTGFRRWGYTRLFRQAESVLTLSDAESRILEREFPKCLGQFQSVYNAYLTDAFLAEQSEAVAGEAAGDGLSLLAAGRLAPQKNMGRLIEAFALAKSLDVSRGQNLLEGAQLTIAGEGPELASLQALAEARGVDGQTIFAGFCDDVPALLRRADMFVLSSNYEGLPAVVIEALGSNCPVVSTDCFPAARELLEGLPGCAVTDRSVEALAEGILKSAADHADRMQLRARALDYSLDSAVKSHLAATGLLTAG